MECIGRGKENRWIKANYLLMYNAFRTNVWLLIMLSMFCIKRSRSKTQQKLPYTTKLIANSESFWFFGGRNKISIHHLPKLLPNCSSVVSFIRIVSLSVKSIKLRIDFSSLNISNGFYSKHESIFMQFRNQFCNPQKKCIQVHLYSKLKQLHLSYSFINAYGEMIIFRRT